MRTLIASAALLLLAASPAAAEDVVATPSPTPTAAAGLQVPDFATTSWIVVDAQNGDILAGQNYDEQRAMASTIKTLTALTLLPRLQYDSTYEARPQETLTEGAHVGVLAGNTYTVSQLFHGMLMRSGNDAAVALADAYGYQRTIDAMNAEAQRVGATRTVAKSPNGLDRPGQVTTAADLAQIYRVAIQDPRLQEILTVGETEFPAKAPTDPTKARSSFTIYNHDSLLDDDYPGFMGGKSGFTSQAGRTYVAGADRDGHKYVVALLGIGGGTTQTARQLLDWSFANADALEPIGKLPEVSDQPEITAQPAGATDGTDLAPMPLDPATTTEMTTIAQNAQYLATQAAAYEPDVPTSDEIALSAQQAATVALTSAGGTAVDVQQVLADANSATATAATGTTSGSGVGAEAQLTGLTQSPYVATAEPAAQTAQRGFFASLLVGLFKAFMWLLLFLGIAVVLLRTRAIRRRNARRSQISRRRQEQSRAGQTTPDRDPAHTG